MPRPIERETSASPIEGAAAASRGAIELRRDLTPVLPLVLQRAPKAPPDRARPSGRSSVGSAFLRRQSPQPFDDQLTLDAEALTDLDPAVIDRVPGGRQ